MDAAIHAIRATPGTLRTCMTVNSGCGRGYDLNQAETFKLILSPLLIGQLSRDEESDWSVLRSNERAVLGV